LIKNFKNYSKGITLVEIVVVISIITLFALILVSDFPKIQKNFALSRATYKLAQDIRRAEDLALSGTQPQDGSSPSRKIAVGGYGVYIDLGQSQEEYVTYADVPNSAGDINQKYDSSGYYTLCSEVTQTDVSPWTSDCIMEESFVNQDNPDVYIKEIENIFDPLGGSTSINFSPPAPTININYFIDNANSGIGIVLGLHSDNSTTRTIFVNTSGLISVQ
jgi:type II secretory pathway pseudopilin PulG